MQLRGALQMVPVIAPLDCSICAAGYWGSNALLYSEECFPCPRVGTSSGMCWGRGVCSDDSRAQALAQGDGVSQLSIPMARGDGNCSCSEWFGGADVMGRMTCPQSECPKGFELRVDIATGIKACQLCLPGYAKALQETMNALLVWTTHTQELQMEAFAESEAALLVMSQTAIVSAAL